MKILIVDDEVDATNMMRIRCEASGYKVLVANNGKDALEIVKKDKPDAVLLDIMMPEVDGLSVLKKIRSEDARLPVFLVTSFSSESRKMIAKDLNASGFIVKGQQDMSEELKGITKIIDIANKYKPANG